MKWYDNIEGIYKAGNEASLCLPYIRFVEEYDQTETSIYLQKAVFLLMSAFTKGDSCLYLHEVNPTRFTDFVDESNNFVFDIYPPDLWANYLAQSPLVGQSFDTKRPFVLIEEGSTAKLFAQRFINYEKRLVDQWFTLSQRNTYDITFDQTLLDFLDKLTLEDHQKAAVIAALSANLTIITGGPGTGKTYTVLALLLSYLYALDQNNYDSDIRIALSAPTGKAVARMKESVEENVIRMQTKTGFEQGIEYDTLTLHQLLGIRPNSTHVLYHKDNPLPYDFIVLDEASMIDLNMMYHLFDAIREDTKIILLGDKDQLASVEAGAILQAINEAVPASYFSTKRLELFKKANLIFDSDSDVNASPQLAALADQYIELRVTKRFNVNSSMGYLATELRKDAKDQRLSVFFEDGIYDTNFDLIQTAESAKIKSLINSVIEEKIDVLNTVKKTTFNKNVLDTLFESYTSAIFLSAVQRGVLSVESINELFENRLIDFYGIEKKPYETIHYPGRAIMIRQNNKDLELYNGDVGIAWFDESNNIKYYFPNAEGYRAYVPAVLPKNEVAFALTIHKSQGSEYQHSIVLLPESDIPSLLTKELLYTAITRAKQKVTIVANMDVLKACCERKINRMSGLKDFLV